MAHLSRGYWELTHLTVFFFIGEKLLQVISKNETALFI